MFKVNGEYVTAEKIGQGALTAYPTQGPRNFFAGGAGLSGTAMDYTKLVKP